MSASELEHRKLEEDRFDISYEELVERRVRYDGPISAEQIVQELKNEVRYDNFTPPDEDIAVVDSDSIEEIFDELRERNRDDELTYDLGVITNLDATYFSKVERPEGPIEESPYWVE